MKKCIFMWALSMLAFIYVGATPVSLDSCRQMALKNNKSLRMADEAIAGAGFTRKAAHAAYLPGIDFTATYMLNQRKIQLLSEDAMLPTMSFDPATGKYNYNILTSPDGSPIKDPASGSYIPTEVAVIPKDAMSFDTRNVVAGAFTLTQPVYMGGQIRALNDIARYGEELAYTSRKVAEQELVYTVDEAYWLVVSLKEKEKLAKSFEGLVDSLKNNVEALLRNGMATKADVLTVEVKLNEARIAVTKVSNGLSLARMALAQLCGLPIHEPMILSDEDLLSEAEYPVLPQFDMADVYAGRQDLELIRKSILLLEGKEKLTLSAMLPKVVIIGAYTFSNPNVINGFQKKFGGGFSIGAALTIPLWHWGGNYNQYKAAKSSTAAQRLLLEDAEEKVQLQVGQAKFNFQEAYKTLDMTISNMKSADENLRMAQLAYREGFLTLDDVTAAQTAWLQAHSEKLDAEIGVRLCNVYLAKVLGILKY